ncbi:F0F1 ATP synthase subunit delta [Candidatus Woesebacteria bacterium]|nr:F0F1 ATP synthase subunit delta [Candidatus Woesebacteria bacterium]
MNIDPALKEELKSYLLSKLKKKQRPKVIVRAPYELSTDDVNTLKKRIELLSEAEIITEVDTSILAGFVIQFGSNVIDVSLNAELQTLAHTLYETV